jgi:FMN phosphatase YigB (HAD superfamily)
MTPARTARLGRGVTPVTILDFDGTIQSEEFPALADPFPGAVDVINQMSERGWQIYVVTGRTTTNIVRKYLKRYGIPYKMLITRPPFEVFNWHEYQTWKQQMFYEVADLENTPPKNILVVDDNIDILELADKIGFVSIRIGGDVDWVQVNQTAKRME